MRIRTWAVGLLLRIAPPLAAALLIPELAAAQGVNAALLSHVNAHRCSGPGCRNVYSEVWGYTAPDGTELAIIGALDGTAFVDVTNPAQPVEVLFHPGISSPWREMSTWDHYCYIVSEGGGGMDIVDLSNPHRPFFTATFDSTFNTAHTIGIHEGYAYVNGTKQGGFASGMRILDLSNPTRPRDVGAYTRRYVHDMYERDNRAYLANIQDGGFTILDVSDKAHPFELSFTPYLGASTHNCWLTNDSRHLLTTDEVDGGHLRIWDLTNLARPLQESEWTASVFGIIHNVYVKGDSAYVSYYTEGLQVLDISNPVEPRRVASYDTWPGASGGFNGNWGVYPFAKSGNVYLSDITTGLYVIGLTAGTGPMLDFTLTPPPSQLAVPGGLPLDFYFDLFNGAPARRDFDLTVTSSFGWPVTVQPSVSVQVSSSEPLRVSVSVPDSVLGPRHVEVELCARSRASGLSGCAQTGVAVPVLLQDLEAAYEPGLGVELRWKLELGTGDTGTLVVLRALAEVSKTGSRQGPGSPLGQGGSEFVERARLGLDARGWRDEEVEPGQAYRYRLALAGAGGSRVLGEVRVEADRLRASRLVGASPNPFVARTGIRFELARPAAARLSMFDVRGRALPGGVYYYELRAADLRAHGRVTLVQ
jgi:choice-of-anchor B domain-containing protein